MATASATQGSGSPSLHSLHPKDKWGRAHLMNALLSWLFPFRIVCHRHKLPRDLPQFQCLLLPDPKAPRLALSSAHFCTFYICFTT